MKTTYILKLENSHNLDKLIKYHVHFMKIKYKNDACFLYVDRDNFKIIEKHFELYDISLVKIEGFLKYKYLLQKNYIFIISMIVGVLFLYLLSNITFDIKIMTNKHDLIKIINNELEIGGLKKYHFIKSYEEKEKIKNKILSDYKDKVEWIEIDRIGTRYYVRILERIISKVNEDIKYQNVIAKRNALILEIKSSSGQIMKKINDYVNKGDIIISGNITKNDEIKAKVKAEGIVFGETWYTVRVELPRSYHSLIYTGNSYKRFTFNIFNKKFFLFGKKRYDNEKTEDNVILEDKLLPFNISKTTVYEVKNGVSIYTYDEALNKGMDIARSKLLDNLNGDSKILSQKKLKLYEENSTIIIDVFFKVYENITNYEEIVEEGD